ncbi:hypothetical protein Pmani_014206 [Petrolisthes manimaculis]|uniref:Uncharacterized protein n=1 Tax=Petrolisthes manimaculis TaxID=1843537 RepID=A0AAE1PUS3_9EUCA|nr:hypothetical protein Pmani_014206 [Petrolisthes manimaculis]
MFLVVHLLLVVVCVCGEDTLNVSSTTSSMVKENMEKGGVREKKNIGNLLLNTCPPVTQYLTLISTQLAESTRYLTSYSYVPTSVVKGVTETIVHTSTIDASQTITTFPSPVIVTHTQVVTVNHYTTELYGVDHTSVVDVTETRDVTDKHVITTTRTIIRTTTIPIATVTTVTTTTTTPSAAAATTFVTNTRYRYYTRTKHVPVYVTQTQTVPPYVHTITLTSTEDEFFTQTSLVIHTHTLTRCSPTTTANATYYTPPYYTNLGYY